MAKKKNLSMLFLGMGPRRRIGALTNINTNGNKVATLYYMESHPYTRRELGLIVPEEFGQAYAKTNMSSQYMEELSSIGMVRSDKDGRGHPTFTKTEDAFTYADPSIVRFLYVANLLGVSLNRLNGSPNSPGAIKHGYVIAMALALLRDGKELRQADIAASIEIGLPALGATLKSLSRRGLVEYVSFAPDGAGRTQTVYPIATLVASNPHGADASGRRTHLPVRITSLGKSVFDVSYGPVIEIAREPRSGAVQERFGEFMRDIDVHGLFREELQRYADEHRTVNGTRTDKTVLSAIQSLYAREERTAVRANDVVNEIDYLSASGVLKSLRRLVKQGELEVIGTSWPTRYRLRSG